MPIHTIAEKLSSVDTKKLTTAVAVGVGAFAVKVYSGGKKSAWEREWGGKLIIIAAPPEPTTFALMHKLLHLPSPPQILYLPPIASPLPQSLLTMLHTMKLAASGNPLAQLNCEPLPPTPEAVRDFVRKWTSTPAGTTGEGGRRVDAIVLGGNWECAVYDEWNSWDPSTHPGVSWTPQQMHFHLITSLLPHLQKAPAERNIRIINLVSPGWSAALPGVEASMQGKRVEQETGLLADAGKRAIVALLAQERLSLVLNTLASAAYSKREVVPNPNAPAKKRDTSVQSNILAMSVIMPWARDEVVRPVWGQDSLFRLLLWFILYPLITLFTPSPGQSVQPILFALNAPVAYINDATDEFTGNTDKSASDNMGSEEVDGDQRSKDLLKKDAPLPDSQRSIRQGSVIRDCQTIELPPVLRDEKLSRATYDRIEEEVTKGVVETEAKEGNRGQPSKAKGAKGAAAQKTSTPVKTSAAPPKRDEKVTVDVAGGAPGQQPSQVEKAAMDGMKAEAKEREMGDKIDLAASRLDQHVAQPEASSKEKSDEITNDTTSTADKIREKADEAKQKADQKVDEAKQKADDAKQKTGEKVDDAKQKADDKKAADNDEKNLEKKVAEKAKKLDIPPPETKEQTKERAEKIKENEPHKGETFADAIKEHTHEDPHKKQQAQQANEKKLEEKVTEKAKKLDIPPPETKEQTKERVEKIKENEPKKGETFADAIKEHTGAAHAAQQPQAKSGTQNATTHDAHVHKGESFADAIKEHAAQHQNASAQHPAQHANNQQHAAAQHNNQQHAAQKSAAAHDAHVHKGESFADAIKEHHQQHQAQHSQPAQQHNQQHNQSAQHNQQAHKQPQHQAEPPVVNPPVQTHVAQGQGKVHAGESFAAALKEHAK